jgi:hypothetical protein
MTMKGWLRFLKDTLFDQCPMPLWFVLLAALAIFDAFLDVVVWALTKFITL